MPAFTVGTYDLGSNNQLNLLAAINAQNSTTYTLAEYGFTDPKRVTIPTPLFNSSIKLGPLAATGKIGFKTIYYNRIHVSDIGVLKITWQNELFLTEMLPRLAEKYGIPLSTSDVYEQRIVPPVAPETEVSLTLNFKESSIAYYGGGAIILGTNDPALEFETPETLPFKNDLVFYVNNFTKTKTGDNYLEASVLSIASDKIRSRTMNVTNIDASPYASIIKNTYSDAQRARLEEYLPFVYTWAVGETKIIRGVTIYGDVVEINETSNAIEKLASLFTFDPLVSSELLDTRTKISVREGTQDRQGNIYLLVANKEQSKVQLLKSSDEGLSFEEVVVTTTNMATFNYGSFENVVVYDLLVANGKLYSLVYNPVSYGVKPGKNSVGPAVEEFNLTTGACDYFPLLSDFVTNTNFSISLTAASKLRFVSTELEPLNVDVVGIAKTSKTLEPVAVYFNRTVGVEYTTEVLGVKILDYPIYGISAYSKSLTKDPSGSFVSFEILTMVPTSEKNDFFLIETNLKTENSYLGYGIVTLSGIRKEARIGGWTEDSLDLGGGSEPMTVTVIDQGKRNHYVFCGGNGVYRSTYFESTPNVFTPSLVKVFDVGQHSGFDLECDIGNGTYVSPEVEENPALAAIYFDYPAEETLKLPIGYSFLVKNKITGQSMWLVAPDNMAPLEERVFGQEYSILGKTPVAVYSDAAGKLYAWTKYQGIYVSQDQGNSWRDMSVAKSYYSHANYLGKAAVALTPGDFKALSVVGDITFAEVNVRRSLSVFNVSNMDKDFALELNDKVVYKVDASKPAGDIILNTAYLTTGLNSTSDFSPRQVIGWDTDNSNNIRALSRYSEEGVAQQLNQLDVPETLVLSAIDVYSDVGFLGLKALVLTKSDADGANMYLVKEDDTVTRVGLRYALTPQFASFDPVAIQPLWDGNSDDISYTPIIITSNSKAILVLERDGLGGNPVTVNLVNLVVPGDNAKDLQWFGMFNSNRRDRYVFQENNGIFKLVYNWDGATSKSLITLVKVFSTSALSVAQVYSGCQYNLSDVTPYSDTVIGAWPVQGTVLGDDCQGTTKREKVADGFGSYFWRVLQTNSPDCGFVVVMPGGTGEGGGAFNVGP